MSMVGRINEYISRYGYDKVYLLCSTSPRLTNSRSFSTILAPPLQQEQKINHAGEQGDVDGSS